MRETSPPLGFHWLRVFLYLGTLLCPPGRDPSSARSLVPSRYQQQAVVGVDEGVGYLFRLPSQNQPVDKPTWPSGFEAGSELSPKGAVTGGVQTGVTVPQELNAMMGKADQQELEEDSGKLLRHIRNWLSR